MQYGKIAGTVVATQKSKELQGLSLKVLIPCDAQKNSLGEPLVALDAIGARSGDLVLWVGKREASMAIPEPKVANLLPVDAAVTGIVDDIG